MSTFKQQLLKLFKHYNYL